LILLCFLATDHGDFRKSDVQNELVPVHSKPLARRNPHHETRCHGRLYRPRFHPLAVLDRPGRHIHGYRRLPARRWLGMPAIFIHPLAGVLSAYGMGLADARLLEEQAVEAPLGRVQF